MFGVNSFGQPYFGQISPGGAARLGADALVAFATVAALTTTPTFAAAPAVGLRTDATLTVQGPLLTESVLVSIGSDAALAVRAVLQASAGLAFATVGKVVVPGDLHADALVQWQTAPPRLDIGAVRLLGESTLAVGTVAPLGTLPATLAGSAGLLIATTGSVTQSGVGASNVVIAIGGAITTRVRQGSIDITDILNEAPNTCTFIVDVNPPPVGTDVKIGLQNLLVPNLLFAGTVKRRDQEYEVGTEQLFWSISCEDYTYLLNRRRVFGTWTNVSASIVGRAILSNFTNGFSSGGIVDGLPPVTVTFAGETVMDALTQVAGLIGGYTKVDYGKVVWLFVTDPGVTPTPIVPGNPLLMFKPPVKPTIDLSQTRTRVHLRGRSVGVVGPPDATIAASPIPIDDATMFASGKVITDDGQILSYTGKDPGGAGAAILMGNVPGPSAAGTPALAPGVAGYLSGTYRWAVAFGNPQGETPVGPASAALFCPDVTSPTTGPGIGATGTVGPLVGSYDYRIAYLTTLGETLAGPSAGRTAPALNPPTATSVGLSPGLSRLSPGAYKWVATFVTKYGETVASAPFATTQQDIAVPFPPTVGGANGPGPLVPGATYRYRASFVTIDGESAPGTPGLYTPSALSLPPVGSFFTNGFGGLFGGAYYYGITFVTALGESQMNVQFAGSSLVGPYPGWSPNWSGGQDGNGRIEKGWTYVWAASYYSDVYGESALGPQGNSQFVGGSVPIRMGINISNFRPTGADGVRIYRAIVGIGGFALNKEFRFSAGVPTSYWDDLSQGECGSNYPIQTLRAGVCMQVMMYPSAETGVIARRLYRTKAGGAEYFLVSEIQSNNQAQITDFFFDNQLAQRNPAMVTTGRLASVSVPTGLAGTIGRRVYRSKRDDATSYFFLADLRDNSTLTFLDGVPDENLVSSSPGGSTGGSNGIPLLFIPTGPPGVLARRIYRTKANGTAYALVAELNDNTTTSFTDNVPDAALTGSAPPSVSSAGGDQHQLTSIPIGPTGTLARLIYRTRAGGGEYGLVTRISDNSTTTFIDTVPDGSLGNGISLVNEAGSSAVNLTNIPIGPSGVTTRIIYRTLAGGSDFHYVGTIDNNTGTAFLDTRADRELGRAPVLVSTIGALIADPFLTLNTVTGFPPVGWVKVDNQYLRYSSIVGLSLRGIPASGPGAIIAPIRGGASVLTVAQLTGVTGLVDPLPVGSQVALWVTSDSLAGQTALAALTGGDGVVEHVVTDNTLDTIAGCAARGQAELLLFQYAQVSVDYTTRDRLTRSGATVPVNLPAPWNLTGEFTIQQVRITEIDFATKTFPKYLVRCSDTKFSLADLLRHVVIA